MADPEVKSTHLSARLSQVRELLLGGCAHKEIAFRLGLTVETVKVYATHLYARLGLTGGRAEMQGQRIRELEQLLARAEQALADRAGLTTGAD